MTIAGSNNDESSPAEEMVSGAGGPGASPGHASSDDAEITRSNAEQLRGLSGRRIKLALQRMTKARGKSEAFAADREFIKCLAGEQDRAIEALARKLADTKGAGPCDEEKGFWPCPLMNPAIDGSDCLNDYGGICWLAWAFTQAGKVKI